VNILIPPQNTDAEELDSLTASRGWKLIQAQVSVDLERAKDGCVQNTELPDLYRAQGTAKALAAVLALPLELARRARERRAK
jgi:hypothetical protein